VSVFELDPKHHIDRQTEKELFSGLLTLEDDTRVLAIQDKGGMGKSSLLEWFAYHCRWDFPDELPCSLTSLSEHADHTPYGLISTIRSTAFERLSFPHYDELDHARADSDFRPFRPHGGAGVATAGTVNKGGVVAGNIERLVVGDVETYNEAPRAWTSAQESLARRELVDAFFEEIAVNASERPIVLMLDAFEHCHEPLRSWVRDRLLREHVFGNAARCHGLVVVVAGRELPEIEELPDHVLQRFVRRIPSLSGWERDHVSEFLKLYKFDPTDKMIDAIQQVLALGVTLVSALQIASQMQPEVHV
jgi:hypothetical protein